MTHYYSEEQDSKFSLKKISEVLRGRVGNFFSAPGIFSKSRIDKGTRLLIDNMEINENDKVLDLGCGYGSIGIVASSLTKNRVILTDINKRACRVAKVNSRKIKNIEVRQGNIYEPVKDELFDVILLNPPQTAGKELCFEMIKDSKNHLNKKGSLQIVARHNKGGKVLSDLMTKVFGNLDVLVKKGGFRVYISKVDKKV